MTTKDLARKIREITDSAPEINLSNFDTEQVQELNDAMTQIHNIVVTIDEDKDKKEV